MNKVYLSGTVYDQPLSVGKDGAATHVVFKLIVRHRAKAGIRSELYRISAWHQCAEYCAAHLVGGTRVALTGYLTQRPMAVGEKKFTAVEVTASEILLAQPPARPLTGEDTQSQERVAELAVSSS